jgi:hypothetical protein
MTILNRPVRRVTAKFYRQRQLCIDARPLYLEIWEKGRRDRVMVDYATLYEFALKCRWRKAEAEKRASKRRSG